MHLPRLLIAIAMLSVCPAIADDAARVILILRAHEAGQTEHLHVETSYEENVVTTYGDEPEKKTELAYSATMTCRRVVDEVAANGYAAAMTIKVEKFELTLDGKTSTPLPPGTIIKGGSKAGKEQFLVDGEPVDDKVGRALAAMFIMDLGEKHPKGNENKAYGVDKPRKVGEEWEIDAKEMNGLYPNGEPFSMNPEKTRGKLKLLEIAEKEKQQAALIQGEVSMEISGLKDMPPQFKFDRHSLRVAVDGLYPLDPAQQPLREGIILIYEITGGFPAADGNFTLAMSIQQSVKIKRLP